MLRTDIKSRSGYLAEITGKGPKFASAVLAFMFMASGTRVAAQAPAGSHSKTRWDGRVKCSLPT